MRGQLGILKDFIEGFDFVRMVPDKSVVRDAGPDGLRVRALSEPGKAYAIYLHFPPGEKSDVKFDTAPRNASAGRDLAVTARLELVLPAGPYRAEWVDTLTGKVEKREEIRHPGGDAVLESPAFLDDIALRITKR